MLGDFRERFGTLVERGNNMRIAVLLLLLLSLISIPASALELVTNPGFEEPLTVGWETEMVGSGNVATRATTYDPDGDYEARIYRGTGSGSIRLSQIVAIPNLDVDFAVNAKIAAAATSTAWAAGAISITYLNGDGFKLGETRFFYGSTYCSWESSNTTHLIPVTPNLWQELTLNLEEEMSNLPGVNPADVSKLKIAMYGLVTDC